MTVQEREELDAAVVIGSAWFIWRDHFRIVDERQGGDLVAGRREREVRLARCRGGDKKSAVWVAAWRVAKYGQPSEAYEPMHPA